MQITSNASLADFSTLRLGGPASHLTSVTSEEELAQAITWANNQKLPTIMIGGGSNIAWKDEGFDGLVIVNAISGYALNEATAQLTVGSGEDWDSVVDRSVAAELSGLELLSLIPGTAGATPVQNVGAYGQEIANVLVSLRALDTQTGDFVTIVAKDCAFGYRTSRFKTSDRGRYYITSLTLQLSSDAPNPPFYPVLQNYFDEHQNDAPTIRDIRAAVIAIRQSKLPDPSIIANNGSFFANPVITPEQLEFITTSTGLVPPQWPTADGHIKIPAAWLLEQAGFKDYHDAETGMGTWPSQPLVLVNESATSTAQLLAFKKKIVDAVRSKFDITLEQEPELLG